MSPGPAGEAGAPPRKPLPTGRRIGLLGGSFDPIHLGHLHAARAAARAFDLERVVFVPAAQSPHKPGRRMVAGRDRMEMVRRAIAGNERWSASSIELERGGISYTIDTVLALAADLGLPEGVDLFLILGSDNVPGLPDWHRVEELLERVQPIVVHREGDADDLLAKVRPRLSEGALARLAAGVLRLPAVEVSSTGVRERLERGEAVEEELPAAVAEYIRSRGIYRSTER